MVAEASAGNVLTGNYAGVAAVLGPELFGQIDIRYHRTEGGPFGVIDADIPVDLIAADAVPVDAGRVRELEGYLLGARESAGGVGSGVLDSVLLCHVASTGTIHTADGFHRMDAIRSLNTSLDHNYSQDSVYATIKLGSDPEDLMDLRIASASGHSEVAFARRALWILDFWGSTPWSEKIEAAHAFGIAAGGKGTGFGLTQVEIGEIREWALNKSKLWRAQPSTLQQELTTARIAAPDLAVSVRSRSGGSRLEAITPQHLKAIINAFSTKEGWDIQRYLASLIVENNMSTPATGVLIDIVRGSRTVEDVQRKVSGTDLSSLKPARGKAHSPNSGSPKTTGLASENRELRLGQVYGESQLAVTGLELALFKVGVVAPRLDLDTSRYFTVDIGGNEQFAGLLNHHGNEEAADMLADRRQRVIDAILKTPDRDPALADIAADNATARIIAAVQSGYLNIINFKAQTIFDKMFLRTVLDEMRLLSGEVVSDSALDGSPNGSGPLRLNLDKVVSAHRDLSPTGRKLVAAHGILGFEESAIAAITGSNTQRVQKALQATRVALSSSAIGVSST